MTSLMRLNLSSSMIFKSGKIKKYKECIKFKCLEKFLHKPITNCLSVGFNLASGFKIRMISNCSRKPISSLMIRVRQWTAFERSRSSILFQVLLAHICMLLVGRCFLFWGVGLGGAERVVLSADSFSAISLNKIQTLNISKFKNAWI